MVNGIADVFIKLIRQRPVDGESTVTQRSKDSNMMKRRKFQQTGIQKYPTVNRPVWLEDRCAGGEIRGATGAVRILPTLGPKEDVGSLWGSPTNASEHRDRVALETPDSRPQ